MWMTAAIAISAILAALTGTVAGFLYSAGHKELSYQYLFACIGFSCIGIFLIIMKAAHKAANKDKSSKNIADNENSSQVKRFKFGVYWDSDLNPLCPRCKTPLVLSREKLIYRIDGGVPLPLPEPHCLRCDKLLALHDDEGNHLTLAEAKKLLSPEEPKQIRTSEEQNEYVPDEIAIEVLKFIARSGYPNPMEDPARGLKLDRSEVQKRLELLEHHGYILNIRYRTFEGRSPYSLTTKGKEFLVSQGLTESELKPKEIENKAEPPQPSKAPETKVETPNREHRKRIYFQTLSHLQLIYDAATKYDYIEESLIEQYHKTLHSIKNELGHDMSEFFIPTSEIKPHETRIPAQPRIGNRKGSPARTEQSKERYCKGEIFLLAVNGAINHLTSELNKPDYRGIPHPSGHDVLDEIKIKILQLLAHPNTYPYEQWLSTALNVKIIEMQEHLAILRDYGYVRIDRFDTYGQSVYVLARKGKQFLIQNNLLPDNS